jgi:hypothetical protein
MVSTNNSGAPKKMTKAPSVALHLPRDAQGLYTRGQAIWNAIKADTAGFPNPYPPAAEVEADLAGLGAALQTAEGGGPIAKAALRVAANKGRQTLDLLGKYVQSVVRAGPAEDAPAIITNVLMFESAVGKRSPKPELEARDGMASGTVQLIARAVGSAVAYFWEVSLDQETWAAGAQTAQARSTITGLTPDKVYSFRFRALIREGMMTDPSQTVSLRVK